MFGLSFLYPLFLAAAAAAAVPVVLHLMRRRTEAIVEFPAARLIERVPYEQQRRRRLREILLLALRVSALVLLAFAFARPYVASGPLVVAPVTLVALDTSMSMSAPGQFDRAREAARQAVQQAPALHRVGLVTFADAASLVVPPTSDRGGVLGAIDRITPGAGGTRFRSALAYSAEVFGGAEGRLIIVTDLQQGGWDAGDEGALPDDLGVEVVEVGGPTGNLAVTAVRRDAGAIVAAIQNFGMGASSVPVRLHVDGQEVAAQTIEIQPHSSAEVRLAADLPARGVVEVRIEDAEGYAADNSRYFVLDPAPATPIVVITADPPASSTAGLYVERALSVADDGRAFQPRVIDGRAFSSLSPPERGEPAAMVLLGTRTLERQGREAVAAFLRSGGHVLLALGPDVDVNTLRDTVGEHVGVAGDVVVTGGEPVALVMVDARHPILRPFLSPTGALGDVQFERYRRLNDQAGRTVLARFSGGAIAFTEQMVGEGRLLVFASDLDNQWNRFPLSPSFVPFAIESARYLTKDRERRQLFTLPEIPPGMSPTPGVHPLDEPGGTTRLVAINVDVKESNPARTTVEQFTATITRQSRTAAVQAANEAREQEDRQRLWQLGLLAMLVALAAEGLIGRKTA